MRGKLLSCLLALSMAGCASTPIPTKDARPTRIILDRIITTYSPESATVTVKRDAGSGAGSACLMIIGINGKDIAELAPAEMVNLYPKSGSHILEARISGRGLCGDISESIDVEVKPGQRRIYRVYVDPSTIVRIRPTTD